MTTRRGLLRGTLVAVDAIPQLNQASAVQGIGVDMQGWDTVAFVAAVAAQGNGGALDIRVVGSANANFSGNVNITGAAIVQAPNTDGANLTYVVEVVRPLNRYVKAIYTPTNNANFAAVSVRSRGQGRGPAALATNTQYVGVNEE